MLEPATEISVTTLDSGDSFALGRLASGAYVLDHRLPDGDRRRLGPVIGDFAPFFAEINGRPHIVVAAVLGESERAAHRVELAFPDNEDSCTVRNGVWINPPRPFVSRMRITATWRDTRGTALRRWTTPPLERRDLQPHADAAWVAYAPMAAP